MGNNSSGSRRVAIVNAVIKADLDGLNTMLNQLTMEEKAEGKYFDEPDASSDGRTPLHLCALRDFSAGAEVLIRCGADKNRVDLYGSSPLFLAAEKNHVTVANTLVMAGCALQVDDCHIPPHHPSNKLRLILVHSYHLLFNLLPSYYIHLLAAVIGCTCNSKCRTPTRIASITRITPP